MLAPLTLGRFDPFTLQLLFVELFTPFGGSQARHYESLMSGTLTGNQSHVLSRSSSRNITGGFIFSSAAGISMGKSPSC